ncbi:MAG TPA: outer membrane beta-barrel protein [Chitinophagaceae bacterium]|nr:outer membrane beta-barrel protein [Chitinophagaceae bacterium]
MAHIKLFKKPGYLLRKPIYILTCSLFVSLVAHSQPRELNRPDHDNLPYYFGLSFSYNNSSLHPTKSAHFLENDSVLAVEPGASGGIALGLLGTLKLTERFQLRFNPQLIVGGSKFFTYSLKYPTADEAPIVTKTLPSTIVSFPWQVKFNSDRIDNFRVYMMGGLKMDIDLASNSAARNAEDLVKLKKYDFGYEAGVGFNIFLKFVTLSPELKVSNGLSNIHSRDPNLKFSSVLDKLQSRMVVFSILLEE